MAAAGTGAPGAGRTEDAAAASPGDAVAEAFRAPERAQGRRRPLLVGAALAAVAALGGGALLTVGAGDSSDRLASGGDGATAGQATATSVDQLTPDQAFTQASEQLRAAGVFGYHGSTSATDVSHVRPGPWLGVEVNVIGQVDLAAGRVHELAASTSSGEVSESVTDGITLWARTAETSEGLAEVSYQTVRQLAEDGATPVPAGAALIPDWLAATVNRQDATGTTNRQGAATTTTGAGASAADGAGTNAGPGGGAAAGGPATETSGSRTFRATLPAAVLGQIEREQAPVDAEVRLTLAAGGLPVLVEIRTSPPGPPLHLAFNITRIGEPVAIDLPTDQPGG